MCRIYRGQFFILFSMQGIQLKLIICYGWVVWKIWWNTKDLVYRCQYSSKCKTKDKLFFVLKYKDDNHTESSWRDFFSKIQRRRHRDKFVHILAGIHFNKKTKTIITSRQVMFLAGILLWKNKDDNHTEAGSLVGEILSLSMLFPFVSLLPPYSSWGGGLPILQGTI